MLVAHRRTSHSAMHCWLWDQVLDTIRAMAADNTAAQRVRYPAMLSPLNPH